MIQIRLRLYLTQTLKQRNHAFRVSGSTLQICTLQFLPNYGLPRTPLLNDKLWALRLIVLTFLFWKGLLSTFHMVSKYTIQSRGETLVSITKINFLQGFTKQQPSASNQEMLLNKMYYSLL